MEPPWVPPAPVPWVSKLKSVQTPSSRDLCLIQPETLMRPVRRPLPQIYTHSNALDSKARSHMHSPLHACTVYVWRTRSAETYTTTTNGHTAPVPFFSCPRMRSNTERAIPENSPLDKYGMGMRTASLKFLGVSLGESWKEADMGRELERTLT